jgi:hypothetical protein
LCVTRANALLPPAADMEYGCGACALCCCGEPHRLFKSFEEDEERTRRLAAALEHESTATSLHFALFPRKTRDGGLQPCCREPVVSMMVRRSALRVRARRRCARARERHVCCARSVHANTPSSLSAASSLLWLLSAQLLSSLFVKKTLNPKPCSGCADLEFPLC